MKKGLRRHATTLGLLVSVLGLGAYLLWVESGTVTTDEALVRADNLVLAWRGDDITHVVLTQGAHTAVLEREAKADGGGPGLFQLTLDGHRFPGSEQAIDAYLGRLEFARIDRRVAEGSVDRAGFGLTTPRLLVDLRMGGLEHHLIFGGDAPSPAGSVYVEVVGRGVFVVTKDLVTALDVPLDTLRSTDLVPYVSSELRSFTLATREGSVRLGRADPNALTSPYVLDPATPPDPALGPIAGRRVGAATMDLWLATLGALEAESFPPDADAKRASEPTLTLTLTPSRADAKESVLVLGGACPGKPEHVVALRSAPTELAACVGQGLAEGLTRSAAALVDRRLVGAAVDEIAEITLREGARVVELARHGTGFHQRVPQDAEVPADVGRAVIDAVARVELTRFVTAERAELGLEPPRATVRLVSASPDRARERVEVVRVGGAVEGGVAVEREEDGARGVIPADALAGLLPNELVLRPREVLRVGSRRVHQLVVSGEAPAQTVERGAEGALTLVRPKGAGVTLDAALGSALVDALTDLRAERWVASQDDGSFGLAPPRITVHITLDADGDLPARTLTLLLGHKTPRGAYAKLDDGAVFVAPPSLETHLATWLVDRSAFDEGLGETTRFTLRGAKGPPQVFVREGDADAPLRLEGAGDPKLATLLQDALADLAPEAAVRVGAAAPSDGQRAPVLTLEAAPRAPGAAPIRLTFGASDTFGGQRVVFARRGGVDATFAVAHGKLAALLEAMGAP